MLRRARQGKARVGEAEMNANFARRIRSVTAYSERTGDDEKRKVGPEAAGQGSGGEIGVRRPHDPDPHLFTGLDRHRRGWVCPVRAPFVRGADRSRRGAGWGCAGHRALVSGAGALALHAKGVRDPTYRAGHARLDLSWFLLPRAAPDRAVEHPRKDHAPHRQQRQPALARRYKRAERTPAGTRLGPRGVRRETGHRSLRPRPEPYREPAQEPPRVYSKGFQLRGNALRRTLRRDLPSGGRAEGEGSFSEDRTGPLPPRRSRPVGSLRRFALALPRRARFRGHDPGRPCRCGAISPRRALRHPARRVGLSHGDHPLPRRLPGGIPAVIVALVFGSPNFESSTTTAILTIVAYVLIQQLEGNFLTPRIQGQALQVHPILVLLAVIAGGELAGLAGVVFAVPALAVFRVLFDFFRVRLRRK